MGDLTKLILEDMPVLYFWLYFGCTAIGALSSFFFSVYKAISHDNKTPFKWSWKHMKKGAIRTFLTLIIMALAVIEWDTVSMILFNSDSPVKLTIWSAFLLGTLGDRIMEMVFGGGQGTIKKMQRIGAVLILGLMVTNGLI